MICRYASINFQTSRTATCSDDLFIKLWNVPDDYKNFATLRGHEHSISSVCFLPGDNQLISSSRDNTVRVWDVSTRCMIDCGTFLLSIHPIADLDDDDSHCIKVLKPHTEWIRSAIPSADGRLLLTCSDDHVGFSASLTKCTPLYSFLQTAHITDIETAVLKTEMRGHDNRIECAVFVPMVSIPAIRELVALVTPKLLPLKL